MTTKKFQKIILNHFMTSGRKFPWRETTDPYKILVSEVMLQQTQAPRVVVKYQEFLKKFPRVEKLAEAKVSEVLALWLGLGYNRRALALKRLAEEVVKKYNGRIPNSLPELIMLPGIGPYTAGAILAFAFNKRTVIIETNIRTVYTHFFFEGNENVDDKDLFPMIEKTLDYIHPREWYWALMDYGSMLKESGKDKGRSSKHYVKQSSFKGSDREVRGKILKLLSGKEKLSKSALEKLVDDKEGRVNLKLQELMNEGFVVKEGSNFHLA